MNRQKFSEKDTEGRSLSRFCFQLNAIDRPYPQRPACSASQHPLSSGIVQVAVQWVRIGRRIA